MTACLYISPGSQHGSSNPCFISDTQVTKNSPLKCNETLPHDIRFDLPNLDNHKIIPSQTFKKCFPISNRSVLAVAGNEYIIRKFIETCKGEILAHEMNLERPMAAIRKIANNFFNNNNGKIEVLGATMVENKYVSILKFNKNCHEDDLLGFMSAIGSGGSELMEIAKDFSINFRASNQKMEASEFVRGLVGGITSSRLIDEGIKGYSSNQWGSMLEYLSYNFAEKKWDHGIKRAFMVFLAYPTGEQEFSVRFVPRIVSYNPGILQSRYSVISQGDSIQFIEWVADNIFDENYDRNAATSNVSFWFGWQPEQVTFSLIPDQYLPHHSNLHKTIENPDFHKVTYEISERGITIGVDNDILNMLGEAYARLTGYKFQEIKNL